MVAGSGMGGTGEDKPNPQPRKGLTVKARSPKAVYRPAPGHGSSRWAGASLLWPVESQGSVMQ